MLPFAATARVSPFSTSGQAFQSPRWLKLMQLCCASSSGVRGVPWRAR